MLLVKNRKATFEYQIVEKYTAGIVLLGYEVKALREKKANFEGAYITSNKDGLFVINLHIGRFSNQSQETSDITQNRPKKLLVTKKELSEIERELSEKGKTAIPLAFVLKNNLVKLEFAVVKSKKKSGKKQTEKERQIEKDMLLQAKELRRL